MSPPTKRSEVPTDEVLALIPYAGQGVFDVQGFCAERGWPTKVMYAWVEHQMSKGVLGCGVSSSYVWRNP